MYFGLVTLVTVVDRELAACGMLEFMTCTLLAGCATEVQAVTPADGTVLYTTHAICMFAVWRRRADGSVGCGAVIHSRPERLGY